MSSTSSPTRVSNMATDDSDPKAQDFARSRIAALLEDSDSDGAGEGWNPRLTAIPSSSQEEQVKVSTNINYDVNLEDEDEILAPAASNFEDAIAAAEEEDDDGSAALARLRKSFLMKKKPEAEPQVQSQAESVLSPRDAATAAAESESSNEDMPVKKTIRRPRPASSPSPARSSSPQLPQAARSPSPALFVSPARSYRASISPRKQDNAGSDSDDMPTTEPSFQSKLKALVAKKKAEREAKELEEQRKKQLARKEAAEKQEKLAKQYKEIYSSEMDDGMTEEARDALVKNSRPTQRKASKKALEEMNRETQRMARNQQLTHQARVKRKYGTADFLRDFGMSAPDSDDGQQSRGVLVSSDSEGRVQKGTPPSSPPPSYGPLEKLNQAIPTNNEEEYIIRTGREVDTLDDELPVVQALVSDPARFNSKSKGKAPASSPPRESQVSKTLEKQPRKQIKISAPLKLDDSDDDLEIVAKKPSRFAVFDRLPESKVQESKSLLSLRALAHMSPPRNQRNGRHGLTHAQLQQQLALQMHKQTVAEKQERIAELRARGIEFKTEEEIEEDQLYIENMLEKARKEAMELGLKENEAAKKNGEDIDENYALPSDDEDEDADFEGEDEEDEVDIEMSGSEDEDAHEEEGQNERTGMFDDAAEEADDDEEDEAEGYEEEPETDVVMDGSRTELELDEAELTPQNARQKSRHRNVILDEDDEDETEEPSIPAAATGESTHTSPIQAFGFAMPNLDLNLTQMFQGTMQETATQEDLSQGTPRQSLDFLRDCPAATLPSPILPAASLLIPGSQTQMTTPSKPPQIFTATPRFPTPAGMGSQMSPTRMSEIPEPTQDVGFESLPGTRTEQPHSTVDTVVMPITESPVALKKGKLRRRAQLIAGLSDEETSIPGMADDENHDNMDAPVDAFDALFKATKKTPQTETFDRKRSEAKRMFEEQAEESEDEYAGLGGASDDESDNGVDEEVQKMIDEGPVDVNEGELAKFFAEKDLADDEKRIDRLYKDITTGALRRKRGVGVDELSDDSDDEAAERRRRKQAEFRKMRQALLLDENVGKIAENPKKSAFLRAIEDREDEDAVDYLGDMDDATDSQLEATQDEQATATPEGEVPAPANTGVKRKLPADFDAGKENVVPNMSHRRRPAADDGVISKKPIGIAEMRESISFLLEEPIVPDSQVSDHSDSEAEGEDDDGPTHRVRQRRNDGNGSAILTSVRASVINRLTVSRQNSMSTDEDSQAPSGPMAFHTSSSASAGVFKMPSLLRRATTNLSNASSNSSSGTTTPTTGTNENAVRMGGSKKSNIHFQAREAERMKKVQDVERRRKEGIKKSVMGKGRVSVLGHSLGRKGSGFE